MSEAIKTQLAKYIIDRIKYPHIPNSLDGEILLEETEFGPLTININTFSELLPKIKLDFKNEMGYKKYMDKWKKEGIDL